MLALMSYWSLINSQKIPTMNSVSFPNDCLGDYVQSLAKLKKKWNISCILTDNFPS